MLQHYNSDKPTSRTYFKTPEGKYNLDVERNTGAVLFQAQRFTRLSIANLNGGAENGPWVVYNVQENLFFSRPGALNQEGAKSVCVGSPASLNKSGKDFPTCHDYTPAKDNVDLVVGMHSGEVLLLSVRAQLASTAGPKAVVAGTYNLEGIHEGNRCSAVAWVPKTGGTVFAAAYHSSGVVHFYRKTAAPEGGGSKFSLGGGSAAAAAKNVAPERVITVGGGGVTDLSFTPDGAKLAVTARDGMLRIYDTAANTLLCGFQSYYGGLLCCAFSPDGQYVAVGGEDDLVAMYCLQDRCVTAWGEGHSSWVCRLAFDPWHQQATPTVRSELASPELVYRLASVGHDCCLCLWDFVISEEYIPPSPTATRPGHMRKVSSGANLVLGGSNTLQDAYRPPPVTPNTPPRPSNGSAITPSTPRPDMLILQPVMQHKIHLEPLSDVAVTEEGLFTADHTGIIKRWLRPEAGLHQHPPQPPQQVLQRQRSSELR